MNMYEILTLLFSEGTFLISLITYLDGKYKK